MEPPEPQAGGTPCHILTGPVATVVDSGGPELWEEATESVDTDSQGGLSRTRPEKRTAPESLPGLDAVCPPKAHMQEFGPQCGRVWKWQNLQRLRGLVEEVGSLEEISVVLEGFGLVPRQQVAIKRESPVPEFLWHLACDLSLSQAPLA